MKKITIGLVCLCVLLGGCSSQYDIGSEKAKYYCKGLGYSGGFLKDMYCISDKPIFCGGYEYKISCYNIGFTGKIK